MEEDQTPPQPEATPREPEAEAPQPGAETTVLPGNEKQDSLDKDDEPVG